MTDFDKALALTLRFEGGYSDKLNDRGGPTMRGVTQVVYDEYHTLLGLPRQPVTEILPMEVEDLYRKLYWERVGLDDVGWPLSAILFDFAVNQGVARAIAALEAVEEMIGDTNEQARAVLALRLYLYRRTAVTEPGQRGFLKGWENRIASLRALVVT